MLDCSTYQLASGLIAVAWGTDLLTLQELSLEQLLLCLQLCDQCGGGGALTQTYGKEVPGIE